MRYGFRDFWILVGGYLELARLWISGFWLVLCFAFLVRLCIYVLS